MLQNVQTWLLLQAPRVMRGAEGRNRTVSWFEHERRRGVRRWLAIARPSQLIPPVKEHSKNTCHGLPAHACTARYCAISLGAHAQKQAGSARTTPTGQLIAGAFLGMRDKIDEHGGRRDRRLVGRVCK